MKKQILFIVMAFFAFSISTAFGQLVPRAITCLPADALHPIAGSPYTYKVDVPSPSGDKTYQWLVTQDKNFIVNKVLTLAAETPATSAFLAAAGATYNIPTTINGAAAVSDEISMTWKSFTYDPAAPVFVIVNVINADGTCSPNNLKVFRIEPINAFTLDIANINQGSATQAYDVDITECISEVISATYNTALSAVDYDYGTDTLYYEVTAANWSTAWNLSVQLTGVDAEETVVVQWATDLAFTTPVVMAGSAIGTGATPTVYTSATNVVPTYPANTTSGTIGAAGESIFIRALIDHSVSTLNYEGLTPEVINLAVDGMTQLTATVPLGDVHFDNGLGTQVPCPALVVDGYTNDIATQTILPRPDVTAAVPATMPAPGLLPVNP